ncbi:MAG: hypothetical protein QJR13_01980, partial [Bacillota bacterium]|nr:hypothetical protein [Bacillota bacterium]
MAEDAVLDRSLEVPRGHGEVLCRPEPGRLAELAAENRRRSSGWSFVAAGRPAPALRQAVQVRALALARAYTAALDGVLARAVRGAPTSGVDSGAGEAGEVGPAGGLSAPVVPFLVVTGHQPLFYHPGVWIRDLVAWSVATQLAEREARGEAAGRDLGREPAGWEGEARPARAAALHLSVDTDSVADVGVEVPRWEEGRGLVRVREVLVRPPGGVPLEAAALPEAEEVEAFCRRVEEHLRTLVDGVGEEPPAAVRERGLKALHCWRRCAEQAEAAARAARAAAGALERPPALADFLVAWRRAYTARAWPPASRSAPAAGEALPWPSFLELCLSDLARTPEFRAWAADLAREARRFALVHNQVLEEYRSQHGYRSRLNPFPNLSVAGDQVELPFWRVEEGWRRPWLVGEGSPPLPPELRPRALALTIFCRLFLADLFLHGVGGGRYDRVADRIIQGFYGIEPPPYAVVSLTLHFLPGYPEGGVEESASRAYRWWEAVRRLRFSPERCLEEPWTRGWWTEEARRRVAELGRRKEEAIALLLAAQKAAERRRAGRTLAELGRELREAAEPVLAAAEEELRRAEARLAEAKAAEYREYPFCFYEPPEVAAHLPQEL